MMRKEFWRLVKTLALPHVPKACVSTDVCNFRRSKFLTLSRLAEFHRSLDQFHRNLDSQCMSLDASQVFLVDHLTGDNRSQEAFAPDLSPIPRSGAGLCSW